VQRTRKDFKHKQQTIKESRFSQFPLVLTAFLMLSLQLCHLYGLMAHTGFVSVIK
jgi:hypothetical protein